ncbi:MAG: 3-hydroxyacyl-ACP dehydratase FabZ [Pseudomonadota bacterium]
MDIHGIIKHLPHRYPFLLVDRVVDCQPGKSIHAYKNVTINEPFFAGHFPHHPIMPGVLIMESLAQAGGILTFETLGLKPDEHAVFYLVGIDEARFKKPVGAGDQLHLHVEILRNMRGVWKYKAVARVEGALVAEATLMCAQREVA